MTDTARAPRLAALIALSLALAAPWAESRPAAQAAAPVRQAAAAPQAGVVAVPATTAETTTARQTRQALTQVLSRYSPNLGRVLALDPGLLQNASYLESYPELAAFIRQHPEVTRDPAYYFGQYQSGYVVMDRDYQVARMWSTFFQGVLLVFVFGSFIAALLWVVKTLIDYRRWNRLSRVQTEVHQKLLDRFTANEDLMAYISTPSGRRFLESAPIAVEAPASSVAAPLRRILWAVEIGLVVMAGAAGLLLVSSATDRVPVEIAQVLWVVGVFAGAVGVGFVLAAGASFLLSKRFGLVEPPASPSGRERDESPAA